MEDLTHEEKVEKGHSPIGGVLGAIATFLFLGGLVMWASFAQTQRPQHDVIRSVVIDADDGTLYLKKAGYCVKVENVEGTLAYTNTPCPH